MKDTKVHNERLNVEYSIVISEKKELLEFFNLFSFKWLKTEINRRTLE